MRLRKGKKGARKSRKGIENGKWKMENYSSPKVGEVPERRRGLYLYSNSIVSLPIAMGCICVSIRSWRVVATGRFDAQDVRIKNEKLIIKNFNFIVIVCFSPHSDFLFCPQISTN